MAATGERLAFHCYSVAEGLGQSQVQALIQDRQGFLWIGTLGGGVDRFDGDRFQSFSLAQGLPSSDVTALAEDRSGALWIATLGGLSRLHQGRIETWGTAQGLPDPHVTSLLIGRDGQLWAGTWRGAARFEGRRFAPLAHDGLGGAAIVAMAEDQSGAVWLALRSGEVVRAQAGHVRRLALPRADAPPVDLRLDHQGTLFVAGQTRLWRVVADRLVDTGLDTSPLRELSRLFVDRRGELWLGGLGGVLRVAAGGSSEPWAVSAGVPDAAVGALLQDRDGSYWLGTNGSGVCQLVTAGLSHLGTLDGLPHPIVMATRRDAAGDLWIATLGGAVVWDGVRVRRPEDLPRDQLLAMTWDRDGALWLATSHDVLRRRRGVWHRFATAEGISNPRALAPGLGGEMIVGASLGLYSISRETVTPIQAADEVPSSIQALWHDRHGRLWVGSASGVWMRQGGGLLRPANLPPPLLAGNVLAMAGDARGRLWIGTFGKGVWRVDPDRPATAPLSLSTREGLADDSIYFLLFDRGGDLWVGTRKGVDRVIAAGAGPPPYRIRHYGAEEGVFGIETNANSASDDGAGGLWFGTIAGAVHYRPGSDTLRLAPLQAVITSAVTAAPERRSGERPTISLRPGAALDHRHREISFEYVAAAFVGARAVRYQVKLDGLAGGWSAPTASRSVQYSLLPGAYAFQVRACRDGGCGPASPPFRFAIERPFWRRAWFLVLVVLVSSVLLWGAVESRTHRQRAERELLERRVAERTRELMDEIVERKHAEAGLERTHRELLEASRLGGMAEIATNVLHNVGNVLNSVNVSVTLVVERLRRSKASGLARLAGLLREHEHDLAAFVESDARGRQLPAYLDQLAEHLLADQQAAASELASLRANVEHIKEIVAMQQTYAKISGVTERIRVSDLVEDSLRINVDALSRHGIEVVRELSEVPLINLDKHKVLQILVNLVRNAKYACDESGRPDKRITLRVESSLDRVRISVIDNGIGIPAENLTRIFGHGFTTRKHGHGFGLHGGALAAQELGGSLSAYSEGAGRGATFTLELPIRPT